MIHQDGATSRNRDGGAGRGSDADDVRECKFRETQTIRLAIEREFRLRMSALSRGAAATHRAGPRAGLSSLEPKRNETDGLPGGGAAGDGATNTTSAATAVQSNIGTGKNDRSRLRLAAAAESADGGAAGAEAKGILAWPFILSDVMCTH